MSATSPEFAKMIPGFDFLQGLVKNAGSVLPGMGQWVAPTLDPAELEKRIEELRTIQFWLEQNARMLAATIQALEVQRMTLSTLKTMNVQMADLHESMRIKRPEDVASHRPAPARPETPPAAAAASAAAPAPAPAPAPATKTVESSQASNAPASAGPSAASLVDPMQWWGALTKQFTELATTAMKDVAPGASTQLADQLVKQSIRAAEQTFKAGLPATKKPGRAAGTKSTTKTRASATGDQPARKAKAAAPAKRPAARRR
jgi:hypothetical protein